MSGHCPGWPKKNGGQVLVSRATKAAVVKNTTARPFWLMAGSVLASSASEPAVEMLNRVVVWASRSRTKMSGHWPGSGNDAPPPYEQVLVSWATRFVAIESKTT